MSYSNRPNPSRYLPRRSVRLRLTLLYGGMFLASGVVLLTITYLLVLHSTGNVVHITGSELRGPHLTGQGGAPNPAPLHARASQLRAQAKRQHDEQLHQLRVQSAIALGLMTIVAVGLGWLVAGRVLRPLRTMTAATLRISERNLHERLALEGPSDELKELSDTIDGLLARLQAAFEAQRRFIANASHELRTPLSMMRTSLDVATGKPGPLPPALTALESKLREGLDQADQLLEGFLTLAYAQRGTLPEHDTVSLAELASAAIEHQREAIAKRDLRVEEDLQETNVTGSHTLLSHMLENLIDNATRHNEPSGWIRVQTGSNDTTAHITVENSGLHVQENLVSELTQPFRRLDGERSASENGHGLGLAIVTAIVDAHGGALELEALPAGGLQVRVELPRTRAGDAGEDPR